MGPDNNSKKLFAAAVIFLVLLSFEYPSIAIFDYMFAILIAALVLFIALVGIYAFMGGKKAYKKSTRLFNNVLYIYIALAVLYLAIHFLLYPATSIYTSYYLIYNPGLSFVLYIAVFFIMSLGTYVACKKNYRIAALLFALAIAILYISILSGYVYTHLSINDEELLTVHAVAAIFNGTNPYSNSIAHLLYDESQYTLLMNNSILGHVNYPSLYFLSLMPFYLLTANPTSIHSIEYIELPAQEFVFFAMMLFAIWYVIDKKDIMKPKPMLYLGIVLLPTFFITSITTYLMFAIIILAYAKLNSKYSWLLLGLAVSIHEELWPIVALMLIYSFNTYGYKKALKDVAGAGAVFLLFNGYFIAINPSAYLTVLSPIDKLVLPDATATIGYAIFAYYHVTLDVFFGLFDLALLFVFALSAYFNNKKALPLLSMAPFLFGSHGTTSYYFFFVAMFAVILYCKPEKPQEGMLRKKIRDNPAIRYSYAVFLILIIAASAALVVGSHYKYINGPNFSITDQHAVKIGNITYYNATLHYNASGANPGKIYLMLNYYDKGISYGYFPGNQGLSNESIINGSLNCTYPCSINPNVIELNASRNTYRINARAYNLSGTSYISAFVYNGTYSYQSQMVEVKPETVRISGT